MRVCPRRLRFVACIPSNGSRSLSGAGRENEREKRETVNETERERGTKRKTEKERGNKQVSENEMEQETEGNRQRKGE